MIVDLFAGGGGASLGIRQGLGRDPDMATNHDREAVAMHAANHPGTAHFCQDVWRVLPQWATRGRPVDLLWASPSCTHFSKARGGKPVERNIRDLAWVVVEWAKTVTPAVIILENVEEFRTWGPLDDDGQPVKHLAGTIFAEWLGKLRRLGYQVEHRELRACDFGAPTIRKRLFVIARRDGRPIVWPQPTHGPDRAQPWRTAAECIDWSLPCPSIFDRKRPLAEATLKRVAAGIKRFVLDAAEPFIVPVEHYNVGAGGPAYGGKPVAVDRPANTLLAESHQALCAAFLAKHYGGVVGTPCARPIGTVTAVDHHSLVEAHLEVMRGRSAGAPADGPAPTVTSHGHEALVAALLRKYYGTAIGQPPHDQLGTVTASDHFGVVTVLVHGQPYVIVDIGLRMLQPRELYLAQGFPPDYIIGDDPAQGLELTKKAQVRLCGNSVCPPIAAALVRAQRLQDISEEDAIAEGIEAVDGLFDQADICAQAKRMGEPPENARPTFALLWDSLNAARGHGWDTNPWVWPVTFSRLSPAHKEGAA